MAIQGELSGERQQPPSVARQDGGAIAVGECQAQGMSRGSRASLATSLNQDSHKCNPCARDRVIFIKRAH
jgi:hypothetical protein